MSVGFLKFSEAELSGYMQERHWDPDGPQDSPNSSSSTFVNDSSVDLPSFAPYDNYPDDGSFYYYLWTVTAPTVFAVFTVVGTVGNASVIYVILSQSGMCNVTNILLINLAVADIAFLLVCVPYNAYKFVIPTWSFGKLPCQVVHFLLYLTTFVTIYTLVAVSGLRYMIMVRSYGTLRYRTKRNAVAVSGAIWTGAVGAVVPVALAYTVKQFDVSYSYCGIVDGALGFIVIGFFVFGYALPLVVICGLYLMIMVHLRSNRSAADRTKSPRRRKRNTRTMRMIVIVVLVFGVSWLPTHVQWLASYFGSRLPDGMAYEILRLVWYCMSFGNSCANPFIYHQTSKEFRKGFAKTYKQCTARFNNSSGVVGKDQRRVYLKRCSRFVDEGAQTTLL